MKVSHGAMLIAKERSRQVEEEGYTSKHDDSHTTGDLARAGACYAFDYISQVYGLDEGCGQVGEDLWPWGGGTMRTIPGMKLTPGNAIKQLTKAGALIAAEIDRLHRFQ